MRDRYIIGGRNQGKSFAVEEFIRLRRNGTCPMAGYDQVGESHYCLECGRNWYGDDPPCRDRTCPFRRENKS